LLKVGEGLVLLVASINQSIKLLIAPEIREKNLYSRALYISNIAVAIGLKKYMCFREAFIAYNTPIRYPPPHTFNYGPFF
jgi:hypothetical protein